MNATVRAVLPAITSLKDEHLALIRALDARSGRVTEGACVLEGAALIGQAVAADAALRFVVCADEAADPITETLAAHDIPVLRTRASLLRQALRLAKPVEWVAVAELAREAGDEAYGDFAVVLDGVRDPGNLGTIVRTAVALGVGDVVCTDAETDLTGRRVLDASRASVLRAAVHRYPSPVAAMETLRRLGFEVVATSSHASVVQARTPLRGSRVALVVGNETDGVGPEVLAAADHVVRIPMSGGVESLNVGVAAGISMYELKALAGG
jgi:TrmH family RNA methyltransferase